MVVILDIDGITFLLARISSVVGNVGNCIGYQMKIYDFNTIEILVDGKPFSKFQIDSKRGNELMMLIEKFLFDNFSV